MMPLTMMSTGETTTIKKVGGKDSRVAIGKDMANKIMV